jgi:hypothetical protein
MKSTVKFGLAALAIGAVFAVSLPVKADPQGWVRAEQLDFFTARGLMPPGSYSHNEDQKPVTIAESKAGQGIQEQKSTKSKAGKRPHDRLYAVIGTIYL